MAALCACDEYLLLTNGKSAALIHFRSPDEIQHLDIPIEENVAALSTHTLKAGKKREQFTKLQQGNPDNEEAHHVQDYDSKHQHSSTPATENKILASAISPNGSFIALCDDKKFLHIYKVENRQCHLHFSRRVVHRVTAVSFTKDNHQVIVADKSGDAYVFHVQEQVKCQGSEDKNEGSEARVVEVQTRDKHEDGADRGSLLLGHMSMLLSLLLVEDDTLIVTSDRDEKIRISHFPDGFNIQAFCLGHTKFVVVLAYDKTRKIIISGSGDSTVRLWDLNGQELHQRNVLTDLPLGNSTGDLSGVTDMEVTQENSDTSKLESAESKAPQQNSQTAIQQICFYPASHILFVSIYRSPCILVYKVSGPGAGGTITLQLITTLGGSDMVASLCISQDVLWVARQGQATLDISAFRIHSQGDNIKLIAVSDDTSSEVKIIRTLSNHTDLLQAPAASQDLIPLLWKSTFQGDLALHCHPKREKVGDRCSIKKKRQKR